MTKQVVKNNKLKKFLKILYFKVIFIFIGGRGVGREGAVRSGEGEDRRLPAEP